MVLGRVFNLWLTKYGPGGNQALRSVRGMTPRLTPASGREDRGFPQGFPQGLSQPPAGSYGALASEFGSDVGVRWGESDPARMLAGVLMLVMVTVITGLALAWWLA